MKLENSCLDNWYISSKPLHLCGVTWLSVDEGRYPHLVLRNPTCHSWMTFSEKMKHYRMVGVTLSSVSHKYCTHRATLNTYEISEFTVHHAYLIALEIHSLLELGQKDISISIPLYVYMLLYVASQGDFWSCLLELIQSASQDFWMTKQNMSFPPQDKIWCNKTINLECGATDILGVCHST